MVDLKNNFEIQASKKPRGGRRPGAGRPKGSVSAAKKAIAELAREHAGDALATLVDVCHDADAPAAARISAANAILDRGYGKAPATMDVTINPIAEAIKDIAARGSAMPIRSQVPSRPAALSASHCVDDEDDDIDP